MKLIFLGTGSAFTLNGNYHSNMLLTDGDKNLLIDCGSDARLSLNEQGYGYKDIDGVYISHLHSDHAGGLEWLGYTTKFDPSCHGKKAKLYICDELEKELWENTLSGAMHAIEEKNVNLASYFDVNLIKPNRSFHWQGAKCTVIPTWHVKYFDELMHSYGLFIETKTRKIFITADTQFKPVLYRRVYALADCIFHDCETSNCHSTVHATYNQLCTLDPAIKKKMWLYHYNQGDLPDAVKDGFAGFVKKGQAFEV